MSAPKEAKVAAPAAHGVEEHMQRLSEHVRTAAGNDRCADCGRNGAATGPPHWAEVRCGGLVCVGCAYHYRRLGIHIAYLRHVRFDRWTAAQVDAFIALGGNAACAAHYQRHMPAGAPAADDGVATAAAASAATVSAAAVLVGDAKAAVAIALPATGQTAAPDAVAAEGGVAPATAAGGTAIGGNTAHASADVTSAGGLGSAVASTLAPVATTAAAPVPAASSSGGGGDGDDGFAWMDVGWK